MRLLAMAMVAVSFALSFVLTGVVKRLAPRLNFVDKPGHRKIHYIPKPLGGGVAIFLSMAVPMLIGLGIVNAVRFDPPAQVGGWMERARLGLAVHQDGMRHETPRALKILGAMLVMHLLGLWDDRKAMGPYSKLAVQLGVTVLVVVWGDLRALTVLDGWGMGKVPSIVVTVLWIAGITNAFNFLDNMDGLSAGVAAVCASAFLVTALLIGQWFVAAMLALLLGALIGFLCYNFAPATIFMGDSGSLVVGLVLGILTVRTTYVTHAFAAGWYAVFAPVIVLAVPLYDLVVVSAIRISRGKSPFVGDTNHLSHRLVGRGMSRRTAVLCIWLITAATSVAAIVLPHVETTFAAMMIFLQTVLILGVVMLLEQHPLPAGRDEVTPQPVEREGS
jgi:UDP-GlcNAc:undecaprenyl-phosphate GlcNAc-1-phosphate transferase